MADSNRYERALPADAYEHDDTAGPKVKRVGNYIYNTDTLAWERWDGTSPGAATEITLTEVRDAINNMSLELTTASNVMVTPSALNVVAGTTITGDVSSVARQNNVYLQIQESASTGITADFTFSVPVGKVINNVHFYGRYSSANPNHHIDFYVFDYVLNDWVHISGEGDDISPSDTDFNKVINFYNTAAVNGSGECKVRLKHNTTTFSVAHNLYTDFIAVEYQASTEVVVDTSTLAKEDTLDKLVGFEIPPYDELQFTYPTTSSMVITYKKATATVATLTITYTDDTKENVQSIVRS